MTTNQQHFAELFEASGGVLTEELNELFDVILMEEFDDNPEKMSEFMSSLRKEEPAPPTPDSEQIAMLQETMLQLTEMIMGGM